MAKFEIYSDGILVGHSDLESGDAPMGVASGKFLPLPLYEQIKRFTAADPLQGTIPAQKHLKLLVRNSEGIELVSSGGVQITDYSADLGPEGLIGIGYPLYEELFPQHVEAYRNQWKH